MPIVLLRMMFRETEKQGAYADSKTTGFSSGISFKYPGGVVLTLIWSPDQHYSQAREARMDARGWGAALST